MPLKILYQLHSVDKFVKDVYKLGSYFHFPIEKELENSLIWILLVYLKSNALNEWG